MHGLKKVNTVCCCSMIKSSESLRELNSHILSIWRWAIVNEYGMDMKWTAYFK